MIRSSCLIQGFHLPNGRTSKPTQYTCAIRGGLGNAERVKLLIELGQESIGVMLYNLEERFIYLRMTAF